eukprot:COSAG03_NODE_201_length_10708_cov_1057.852162_8_plen_1405_part_00
MQKRRRPELGASSAALAQPLLETGDAHLGGAVGAHRRPGRAVLGGGEHSSRSIQQGFTLGTDATSTRTLHVEQQLADDAAAELDKLGGITDTGKVKTWYGWLWIFVPQLVVRLFPLLMIAQMIPDVNGVDADEFMFWSCLLWTIPNAWLFYWSQAHDGIDPPLVGVGLFAAICVFIVMAIMTNRCGKGQTNGDEQSNASGAFRVSIGRGRGLCCYMKAQKLAKLTLSFGWMTMSVALHYLFRPEGGWTVTWTWAAICGICAGLAGWNWIVRQRLEWFPHLSPLRWIPPSAKMSLVQEMCIDVDVYVDENQRAMLRRADARNKGFTELLKMPIATLGLDAVSCACLQREPKDVSPNMVRVLGAVDEESEKPEHDREWSGYVYGSGRKESKPFPMVAVKWDVDTRSRGNIYAAVKSHKKAGQLEFTDEHRIVVTSRGEIWNHDHEKWKAFSSVSTPLIDDDSLRRLPTTNLSHLSNDELRESMQNRSFPSGTPVFRLKASGTEVELSAPHACRLPRIQYGDNGCGLKFAYQLDSADDDSAGIGGTYELRYPSRHGEKCHYAKRGRTTMVLCHTDESIYATGRVNASEGCWYITSAECPPSECGPGNTVYQAPGSYLAGPPEQYGGGSSAWVALQKDASGTLAPVDKTTPSVMPVYSLRFRELNIKQVTLQLRSWMGVVRFARHDSIERLLLQFQTIFAGVFQLALVYIVYETYQLNQRYMQPNDPRFNQDLGPLDAGLNQTLRLFKVNDVFEKEIGISVSSSELLLPVAMYVFVALLRAHESATFSVHDQLTELQEDTWYRKAILKRKKELNDVWTDSETCGDCCYPCRNKKSCKTLMDTMHAIRRVVRKQHGCALGFILWCLGKRRSQLEHELIHGSTDIDGIKPSYAKRDLMRAQELDLTFIEGVLFQRFRRSDFKNAFPDLRSEPIIAKNIELIRENGMQVFYMEATGSEHEEGQHNAGDLVKEIDDETVPRVTGTVNCCTSVGPIAELIIMLSRAHKLAHARRRFWTLVFVSAVHGALPMLHTTVPNALGGGCTHDDDLDHPISFMDTPAQYLAQRVMRCYLPEIDIHFACMLINASLTFTILSRLARCERDYLQRYYQMLYFIQLTPWATFRPEKEAEHFGILPRFGLDCPRNIEAWNKLRLYLQSYNIVSSNYAQVSVGWCMVGVSSMVLYEISRMVMVQMSKVDLCAVHAEWDECIAYRGMCKWEESNAELYDWATVQELTNLTNTTGAQARHHGRCIPNCEDLTTFSACAARKLDCHWDDIRQCETISQRFDDASMFVLVDSVVFGVGLIATMWKGMLANEIKQRGFPYVLRMQHTALYSKSMSFLGEQKWWATQQTHRRHGRNSLYDNKRTRSEMHWTPYDREVARALDSAAQEDEPMAGCQQPTTDDKTRRAQTVL